MLAGLLIEVVTGRSWAREVDARITGPLGLRHTRTGFVRDLPAPHAKNYMQFSPGGPLVDTTIAIRGLDSGADGSMISAASDLNRFLAALAAGRLLWPRLTVSIFTSTGDPELAATRQDLLRNLADHAFC